MAKWQKYSTRGPSHGPCNICGSVGRLTDDHVPPKGCRNVSTARMSQLFQILSEGRLPTQWRQAQGGVKYRTICGKCNNGLLGAEYDPSLIEWCSHIDQFLSALRSGIRLPSHTATEIRPNRILRSVIGHMLAAAVDRPATGDFDQELVEYFLDPTRPFPASARLYYWLYPFTSQVVIRDAVYKSMLKVDREKNLTLFMLLKFYPVAFMVADARDDNTSFKWTCLSEHASAHLDDSSWVPIYLNDFPSQWWPEAPSESHFVVYGGEPLFAQPGIGK